MKVFIVGAFLATAAYVLDWIGFCWFLQCLNSAAGLNMWFACWQQVERFREVNEERDSLFPAFRRQDARRWNKWSFFLGAITGLINYRAFIIFPTKVVLSWFSYLLNLGQDLEKPQKGWRKVLQNRIYQICCGILLKTALMSFSEKKVDFDYSYYLGPDYK